MKDGFTLELVDPNSEKADSCPPLRIKKQGTSGAKINFQGLQPKRIKGGDTDELVREPPKRGYFVDVSTLGAALFSRRFSLKTLCEHLRTETQKTVADAHGVALSDSYLDYAMTDVQATWECYDALQRQLGDHGINLAPHSVYSEASLGKAYLDAMGIKSFQKTQPDFPKSLIGSIMSAYYGGRTETHLRRQIAEVSVVDFKSMYPTVCALMGLWEFVIAKETRWRDSTEEVRALIDRAKPNDLQNPKFWQLLRTIVRIVPNSDQLPVRAPYNGSTTNIGLNFLTAETELCYTLADVLVSKFLTGRTPDIIEALTFEPGPPQDTLRPINLFGLKSFKVDPRVDDAFVRLVQLRTKAKRDQPEIQKAIKIIVNAMSYGIFIQINKHSTSKKKSLDVYGSRGECVSHDLKVIETPGNWFHPLLATLITGAARLMLGLAQFKARENDLEWAYCDTDSLVLTSPSAADTAEVERRLQATTDWFKPLNPYGGQGSILEVEDENFAAKNGVIDKKKRERLFLFAVSSKRYCLFNLGEDGKPILRKVSSHGLGHLVAPYTAENPSTQIPEPIVPLSTLGCALWHHDLWYQIVSAALAGNPDMVDLSYHPALQAPAMSKYTCSSPHMERWFKDWNDTHKPDEQVWPFNFLSVFYERKDVWSAGKREKDLKPVAPFRSCPWEGSQSAFCRSSGEHVESNRLQTYAQALADYHLNSEHKFQNGDTFDSGWTSPRHVRPNQIVLIGKEANRIGSGGEVSPEEEAVGRFRAETIIAHAIGVIDHIRTKALSQ